VEERQSLSLKINSPSPCQGEGDKGDRVINLPKILGKGAIMLVVDTYNNIIYNYHYELVDIISNHLESRLKEGSGHKPRNS